MREYLTIPFLDHGRDRAGCDCFGLVRMVLAERHGIYLPTLSEGYAGTEERVLIAGLVNANLPLLKFAQVHGSVENGDVAVIRQGGQPCHVGIMVAPHTLLHTESGSGPKLEDIRRPHISPRIEGFYRHE
jgi:cell wall-associated NlpC family hydrolase